MNNVISPEVPDVPLLPLTPDVPDVPLLPLTPEVPLTPDVPDVPDVPEVPDVPLLPLIPEVPLVPLIPLVPEVPDVPLPPPVANEDVAICNVLFPVLSPTQTYPSLKDAVNDELTFNEPLKLILPFLIFNEPDVRYSDSGASNPILTSPGR